MNFPILKLYWVDGWQDWSGTEIIAKEICNYIIIYNIKNSIIDTGGDQVSEM